MQMQLPKRRTPSAAIACVCRYACVRVASKQRAFWRTAARRHLFVVRRSPSCLKDKPLVKRCALLAKIFSMRLADCPRENSMPRHWQSKLCALRLSQVLVNYWNRRRNNLMSFGENPKVGAKCVYLRQHRNLTVKMPLDAAGLGN